MRLRFVPSSVASGARQRQRSQTCFIIRHFDRVWGVSNYGYFVVTREKYGIGNNLDFYIR